ncbi:unnamed protein product [Rotaria magnacalcarata]|nr:unnamed protein product [Rotaria magnacalcarata]
MLDSITLYNPHANLELIEKAYKKCKKWHGLQKRKSGEPYYTHPKEIIKMQLDDSTIITALLHDIIEDTNVTFKKIEKNFSTEIAELVEGVTKLDKINFQLEQIKQAENFRKLFLALAKDIRVLVVKLCDRLHNMRTIGHKNGSSIKRIAVETLEIYAPLAERIGMHDIAGELQDLSFGAINSRARNSVIKRLEQIKSKTEDGQIVSNIITELSDLLTNENIESVVKGREKSPYSIWKKLIRKGTTFDKLIDVVGFRIITDNQKDCYTVLGIIHSKYKAIPDTFADYISLPKSNGYKSIHTVVMGPFLQRIEIQIRTKEMDIEAEYGLAAHWSYKQSINKLDEIKKGMEIWITTMLDILKSANNAEEFLETTKLEMYTEQIFAFTPEGDIIDLPQGATIIDFAFAISNDVGNLCDGAKVNNFNVGNNYKIKNGDQIKINTSKAVWPSIDWMQIATTGRAKHAIKKATYIEQNLLIKAKGMEILSRLFARYNHKINDKVITELLNYTKIKSVDDLYINIASNAIDITTVIKEIYPDILYVSNAFLNISSFDGIGQHRATEKINSAMEKPWLKNYHIDGLPECFLHKLSYCCKPNIGDSVIGISIPNDGIFIHKKNCTNLAHFYLENYLTIDHLRIGS